LEKSAKPQWASALPRLGLGTFGWQGYIVLCRAAVESGAGAGGAPVGISTITARNVNANEDRSGAGDRRGRECRAGELHVTTTKVWQRNLAAERDPRAFDASLKRLRLDHVVSLSGALAFAACRGDLPAIFETLPEAEAIGRPAPSRRRQFFTLGCSARARRLRSKGPRRSRLQPDLIPCDGSNQPKIRPNMTREAKIRSRGGLLPAGHGRAASDPDACDGDRPTHGFELHAKWR